MIVFNVPPYTGNEMNYMKEAVEAHKICGDGQFTQKCNAWIEEKTGTKKALLTTSCTHATELAALLADIKGKDFYRTRIRNLKDSAEKPQLEELFSEISQERRFLWKKSDILEQYVSFIDSLFES